MGGEPPPKLEASASRRPDLYASVSTSVILRVPEVRRVWLNWIVIRSYVLTYTVSFPNFKSQNFKLSVSNPKSKYVAYVPVLSRISNCQGLGRKYKHETLKTDRMQHRWLCHTLQGLSLAGTRSRCSGAASWPGNEYFRIGNA